MGTRDTARRLPARLTACGIVAVSPSSSVQRARQELADRLRDIRLDAGLTGRALPASAGWREAKTSRIESAKQAPSDPRDPSRYGTVLPAVDLSGPAMLVSVPVRDRPLPGTQNQVQAVHRPRRR